MKATRYIAAIALLAGLMSCQREKELVDAIDETCPDGFVEVVFTAGLPEPVALPTRSKIMGEGADEDDFELYLCLYGPGDGFVQSWIPTTRVRTHTNSAGYVTSIEYKALLPVTDEKRTIHLIVNPPVEADPTLTDYMDNVMEKMVDVDQECSYWQQVVLPNGISADGSTVTPLLHVDLVRNFVKLIATSPDEFMEDGVTPNALYEGFTLKQWTLINVPDKGYVAPYTGIKDEALRFPTGYLNIGSYPTGRALLAQLTGKDDGQDNYKGSIPSTASIIDAFPGDPASAPAGTYVGKDEALYFYERPLPTAAQKQTAVLAEIEFDPGVAPNPSATDKTSYWYKIEVLDDQGAYVPFLRNLVYHLDITGVETEGEATAEDAYNGPYFGNISASLETASLNELSNGKSLIHVDQMDYTFLAGSIVDEDTGDVVTEVTELLMFGDDAAHFYYIPYIEGDEDKGVAPMQAFYETTENVCEINVEIVPVEGYDPSVTAIAVNEDGDGTIRVTLAPTGNKVKKSVIRVSGRSENKTIYREITVNLMTTQSFKHGENETAIIEQPDDPETCGLNQAVKIRIQLPEDLGASLFPIQVRIEAENNSLSATSPDLPVLTGKSVFPSKEGKNTFFYVKTIKYSDYCKLDPRTKKYKYYYEFDCTFYTTKTGDNSTEIDVREMKGTDNFNALQLTLAKIETP